MLITFFYGMHYFQKHIFIGYLILIEIIKCFSNLHFSFALHIFIGFVAFYLLYQLLILITKPPIFAEHYSTFLSIMTLTVLQTKM